MESIKQLLGSSKTKDNLNILVPRTPKTQSQTDNMADYLVDKYHSPEFRPIFLRVAWRLETSVINRIVAASFELGKNPRSYFIACVKREKGYK